MEYRTTTAPSTTAASASNHPTTGQHSTAPAPRGPSPSPAPGDGPAGVTRPAPLTFSPARLRAWRHLRGTDHPTLAHAAGTTSDDVAACEAGRQQPHTRMITAWATVLGCRPDQLLSTTPEAPDEYWQAANQAMEPMSSDDLAVVADVILRSHTRRSHQPSPHTGRP